MSQSIEVYVHGENYKKAGAAYGIVLAGKGVSEDKSYFWERSFEAADVTTNQAILHGINFALRNVKQELRGKREIVLCFNNKFVHSILERKGDEWTRNPSSNKELVEAVRGVVEQFLPAVKIITGSEERQQQLLDRAKALSDMAAKEKNYVDVRG